MSRLAGMLHQITLDAVSRAADRLAVSGLDPETVDLDALLVNLAEIAYWRPVRDEGRESELVRSLIDLAARALLWSQSADDLVDILAGLPVEDDDTVEALLAEMDERAAQRPAGTRRESGEL